MREYKNGEPTRLLQVAIVSPPTPPPHRTADALQLFRFSLKCVITRFQLSPAHPISSQPRTYGPCLPLTSRANEIPGSRARSKDTQYSNQRIFLHCINRENCDSQHKNKKREKWNEKERKMERKMCWTRLESSRSSISHSDRGDMKLCKWHSCSRAAAMGCDQGLWVCAACINQNLYRNLFDAKERSERCRMRL